MIPIAWADSCEAPPGYLLVEREEMPIQARGLWLPDGYRNHTLSGTAKIISGKLHHPEVFPNNGRPFHVVYGPGTYVLLTASAGKPIVFGYGGTTRTLARITAGQILAVLTGKLETKAENAPPVPLDADLLNYGNTFDAGDPKALR